MPHIVLEKANNVKACYDAIESMVQPVEKGILKITDKYLDYRENSALLESIVVENGKHVGIITEKDIGLFLFSETTRQGLDEIPITKIMKPIEFVNQEITPENSAKIMVEKNISSLAIGEKEEVKTIFTKSDLVSYYADWIPS